ncbi:MAG: S8 family serine peptidase [Candidatus Heimdallarchaeota archaeon]
MRQGRKLSIFLLSLFILSSVAPLILDNATLPEAILPDTAIYTKTIVDLNGDKLDDKLMKDLEITNTHSIDVVVLYDHKVNSLDKLRLRRLGVTFSKETWDLGRRLLVSTTKDGLEVLAKIPEINLITSAEKRHIMVGILGDDNSDLAALERFEGIQIFWGVGCAVVPYYTGLENDIAQLGTYTAIADTTDSYLYKIETPQSTTTLQVNTLVTANEINITGLWADGHDGTSIRVGNIDTGINENHVDFAGRIISTKSFVSPDYGYDHTDDTIIDFDGHGTHTTGIMAGSGDGDPKNIGMAPNSSIYFAKVESPATWWSVIAALDWLVNNRDVDVVNLSFGGGAGEAPSWNIAEIAFKVAVRKTDTPCLISAGNEAMEGFDNYYSVSSPGSVQDVITVGSLDTSTSSEYGINGFSSRGPTGLNLVKPDVLAPGNDIASCSNIGITSYISYSGTSMAAPHVAGAVAVLIDAMKNHSISYNPGVIKAALLKTAIPLDGFTALDQGKGYINVGAALTYILNAEREGNLPIIGSCNQDLQPIKLFDKLRQGQISEQYLTTVSPFRYNKSLALNGDAAQFVTITSDFLGPETDVIQLTYKIPVDATIGTYTGQIDFVYNGTILDTVDIDFDVVESNGHNMLLNYRTTNYGIDHMYGQYMYYTQDIYANGYVISEQNITLNETILANYDCVWFPDPFGYKFPQGGYGDYSIRTTYNPWASGELTALNNYVANGGTVFFAFIGYSSEFIEGYGTIVGGTNVSVINEFTIPFGIEVLTDEWPAVTPGVAKPLGSHALTAGVVGVDHYGCSLEITGDAVAVSKYEDIVCATYQHDSGGRVIVLATNFCLDTEGYKDRYNGGFTNNTIFAMNLMRWATSEHKIRRTSVTNESGIYTLTYEYLSGPGPDFGGYVLYSNKTVVDLTWTEVSDGIWKTAVSTLGSSKIIHVYPECGETGVDEFDYYKIFLTGTDESGFGALSIVLIAGFGLAGWYLIQKRRR